MLYMYFSRRPLSMLKNMVSSVLDLAVSTTTPAPRGRKGKGGYEPTESNLLVLGDAFMRRRCETRDTNNLYSYLYLERRA